MSISEPNISQINSKQNKIKIEENLPKENKEKQRLNPQEILSQNPFNLSNKIPQRGKYQNFSKNITPIELKSLSKDPTIGKKFNLNNVWSNTIISINSKTKGNLKLREDSYNYSLIRKKSRNKVSFSQDPNLRKSKLNFEKISYSEKSKEKKAYSIDKKEINSDINLIKFSPLSVKNNENNISNKNKENKSKITSNKKAKISNKKNSPMKINIDIDNIKIPLDKSEDKNEKNSVKEFSQEKINPIKLENEEIIKSQNSKKRKNSLDKNSKNNNDSPDITKISKLNSERTLLNNENYEIILNSLEKNKEENRDSVIPSKEFLSNIKENTMSFNTENKEKLNTMDEDELNYVINLMENQNSQKNIKTKTKEKMNNEINTFQSKKSLISKYSNDIELENVLKIICEEENKESQSQKEKNIGEKTTHNLPNNKQGYNDNKFLKEKNTQNFCEINKASNFNNYNTHNRINNKYEKIKPLAQSNQNSNNNNTYANRNFHIENKNERRIIEPKNFNDDYYNNFDNHVRANFPNSPLAKRNNSNNVSQKSQNFSSQENANNFLMVSNSKQNTPISLNNNILPPMTKQNNNLSLGNFQNEQIIYNFVAEQKKFNESVNNNILLSQSQNMQMMNNLLTLVNTQMQNNISNNNLSFNNSNTNFNNNNSSNNRDVEFDFAKHIIKNMENYSEKEKEKKREILKNLLEPIMEEYGCNTNKNISNNSNDYNPPQENNNSFNILNISKNEEKEKENNFLNKKSDKIPIAQNEKKENIKIKSSSDSNININNNYNNNKNLIQIPQNSEFPLFPNNPNVKKKPFQAPIKKDNKITKDININPIENENEIINIKEINDNEFDNFLQLAKNNKKNLENFTDPFEKANKISTKVEENNTNFIESEFISGKGKKSFFQKDSKINKLIQDMEKDYIPIDNDIIGEEDAKIAQNFNKKNLKRKHFEIRNNDSNNDNNEIKDNFEKKMKLEKSTKIQSIRNSNINEDSKFNLNNSNNNNSFNGLYLKKQFDNLEKNKLNNSNNNKIIIPDIITESKKLSDKKNLNNLINSNNSNNSNSNSNIIDNQNSTAENIINISISKSKTEDNKENLLTEKDKDHKDSIIFDDSELKKNHNFSSVKNFKIKCDSCPLEKEKDIDNKIYCKKCGNNKYLTIHNIKKIFINFYKQKHENPNSIKNPQNIENKKLQNTLNYLADLDTEWFTIQFHYTIWKFYNLSSTKNFLNFENLLAKIHKNFLHLYNSGLRSFLTKLIEKDYTPNNHIILLIYSIELNDKEENFLIKLTDAHKSIYSKVQKNNPIYELILNNYLQPGIKIHIAAFKFEEFPEGDSTRIFINLSYNAISIADNYSKLGLSEKKFLLKNILNLKEDGGFISQIDIVILKKYNFYFFDKNKKISKSQNKYEKDKEEEQIKIQEELIKQKNEESDTIDNENFGTKKNKNNSLDKDRSKKNEKNEKNKKKIEKKNKKEKEIENLNASLNNKDHLSINYKLICVDSSFYFMEFCKENKENARKMYNFPKGNFPENLKKFEENIFLNAENSNKLCTIDFKVNNTNIFEEIKEGNRYFLSNLNKNFNKNFKRSKENLENIKLTAYSDVGFAENENNLSSLNPIHKSTLDKLHKKLKFEKNGLNVSDELKERNFNYANLQEKEFYFRGILQDFIKVDKKVFVVFKCLNKFILLLEIADNEFFDLTCFKKNNFNAKIFKVTNVLFKIVNYFSNDNKIVPIVNRKFEDLDKERILIHLEASFYSDFIFEEVNSKIKSVFKSNSNSAYKEFLGRLSDCIKGNKIK